MKNFKELAKLFKSKYDGLKITPKLPTQIKASFKRWKKTHILRDFLESTKEEYGRLVAALTKNKVDGSALVANEIDDSQRASPSDTAPQYVPPSSAPLQQEPLSDANRLKRDHPNKQRCAWWPRCAETASACGGFRRDLCRLAGSAFQKPESIEELTLFNAEKAEAQRLEKREKERERKRRKKEEKQRALETEN